MPDISEVSATIRKNGKAIAGKTPTFTIEGQKIFFTYTPTILQGLTGLYEHYFKFGSLYLFAGELNVIIGYGEANPVEYQVSIQGYVAFVVEISGGQASNQLFAEMVAVKGEAVAASESAIAAQEDVAEKYPEIIEARDQVVAINNANVTVATYAAAVPYFTGDLARRIYVLADEAYNDGVKSFYDYKPGFGIAFMGIDFNYTDTE